MNRVSHIPLFASTEEAERYGRELRRVIAADEFQALVGSYFISELAAREAINPQAKVHLATRSQTLREAIQAFLFEGRVPLTKSAKVTEGLVSVAPSVREFSGAGAS
jgi:hypothetical protein